MEGLMDDRVEVAVLFACIPLLAAIAYIFNHELAQLGTLSGYLTIAYLMLMRKVLRYYAFRQLKAVMAQST